MEITISKKTYDVDDTLIIVPIIILFTFGLGYMGMIHTENTNERFDDVGTVIDKWATEDYVFCLVEVHGERYQTKSSPCMSKIVGDKVDVVMNRNLESFNITMSGMK